MIHWKSCIEKGYRKRENLQAFGKLIYKEFGKLIWWEKLAYITWILKIIQEVVIRTNWDEEDRLGQMHFKVLP